jgi:hypothetical protein
LFSREDKAALTAAFGVAPGDRACVEIGVALGYFAAVVYGITKDTTGNPGSVSRMFPAFSSTHSPVVQIRNGTFVQHQFFEEFLRFHGLPPFYFLYCESLDHQGTNGSRNMKTM